MKQMIQQNLRLFQILSLLSFFFIGMGLHYHQTSYQTLLLYMTSCLLFQFGLDKLSSRKLNWQSPVISSLSLSILLKTGSYWGIFFASLLTIFSKSIKINGQHFFNPTAFSITFGLIFFPNLFWVEVGQWGTTFFLWAMFFMFGLLVISGTPSRYITLSFFLAFLSLNLIRSLYLGDPMSILIHQFQSVGFILFCFFMISDPRSTPHSLTGKISFGVITALIAFYLRYFHFESYFLYYSLFIASFFTPLLNKTFHQNAARFEWAKA